MNVEAVAPAMTALDLALARHQEEQEFRAAHPDAAREVRYERASWNSASGGGGFRPAVTADRGRS